MGLDEPLREPAGDGGIGDRAEAVPRRLVQARHHVVARRPVAAVNGIHQNQFIDPVRINLGERGGDHGTHGEPDEAERTGRRARQFPRQVVRVIVDVIGRHRRRPPVPGQGHGETGEVIFKLGDNTVPHGRVQPDAM